MKHYDIYRSAEKTDIALLAIVLNRLSGPNMAEYGDIFTQHQKERPVMYIMLTPNPFLPFYYQLIYTIYGSHLILGKKYPGYNVAATRPLKGHLRPQRACE